MRCQHVQDKLQEYLDGLLPLSEARAVETHLAECAACREDLALFRQVDDALATLPLLQESANFTAQVMARVRATEPSALQQRPILSGTRDSGQASPVPLPAFRLRWEDAVVSFAFACAAMALLSAFSLLQPQHVSVGRAFLHRAWWTFLPELDWLWHTMQVEPIYAVWGLSSLCVAMAAAASAIALVRQWQRRSVAISRRR